MSPTKSRSSPNLKPLEQWLRCPEDGQPLTWTGIAFGCHSCGDSYPASAEGILDFRPTKPSFSGTCDYSVRYQQSLATAPGTPGKPWGTPEALSPVDLERKRKHIAAVKSMLFATPIERPSVLCDLSGGAGHYTLSYARDFDFVLHCDLDPASLSYTRWKASERGLNNIFFLRADYFRPPFARSLRHVLSLDTLIRGPEHEARLLASIRGVLSPGGMAVVDFHNWWHNPLRRLGLLKQTFGTNVSYSRAEAERLLAAAGFEKKQYRAFRQEKLPPPLVSLIPPTRMIFRVSSSGPPPVCPPSES